MPGTCLRELTLPTTDDWHPNHPRNTVRCSIYCDEPRLNRHSTREDKARKTTWRVCVWGADDEGMEKSFYTLQRAELIFRMLPNPITKQWLEESGFKSA